MAEPSAPSVSSIKARIAALNIEEVHAPAPGAEPAYKFDVVDTSRKSRPPPPPPPSQRPSERFRQNSTRPPVQNSAPPTVNHSATTVSNGPKQQPALPPRPPPRGGSGPPSLPPRKASGSTLNRRDSSESISTVASGRSGMSGSSITTSMSGASYKGNGQIYQIKAPAYDPSKLPPLPPKRTATEEVKPVKTALKQTKSFPAVPPPSKATPPSLPSRPPLPVRPHTTVQNTIKPQKVISPPPRRSALEFGLNKSTEIPPPIPSQRPNGNTEVSNGAPPPIPLSSRPNLAAIQASKPKPAALNSCLKCRDFSAVDAHASKFPRQSIPSTDIGWIATQLTAPFPSLTDKARALFSWLHFNIDYNVQDFFNDNVQHSTPENTIRTGLAVCEGYSRLFTALADKVGLESVVISGDGKGFGHSPLQPGQPIPPFKSTHAWNAVRIDGGEWKLIDCCWGAGHVQGAGLPYVRKFAPECFTMDNNEFGLKHFPEDRKSFYRTDGRAAISWEEYVMNDVPERLQVYSITVPEYGIGERTFQPVHKHIKVHDYSNGPTLRFQFATVCPHWDHEKNGKGKPCIMVLHVGGKDGRKEDYLPFETDGRNWWLDAPREQLGCPGQKVSVYSVKSFDGKSGRGLSLAEFKQKWGRVQGGFDGIAMWELV